MATLKIKNRLGLMRRPGNSGITENTVITKSVRSSGITLSIVKGRLEKEDVDVVVNSIAVSLNMEHGLISSALSRKAGSSLQAAINEFPGPVKYGDLFKTAGFRLRAHSIIHVVLCGFNYPNSGHVLEGLVLQCLQLADKDQYTSISIPGLGSGRHSFPPFVVAHRLMEAVRRYEVHTGKDATIKTIRFVLQDQCIDEFQILLNDSATASQAALVENMKLFHGFVVQGKKNKTDECTAPIDEAATDSAPIAEGFVPSKVKRPTMLATRFSNVLNLNRTLKKAQLVNQLRTMYLELPQPTGFMSWTYVVTSKGRTLCSSNIDELIEAIVGAEVHQKRNLVLVHGPTYVGKSSLINRIARLWANGELKHIRLVILVNLTVQLSASSTKIPSLRECLLQCIKVANIDKAGGQRLLEFSSGKMLLLLDDAEPWCEHFYNELQKDRLFAKVHVIVTSRSSSSAHLADVFRPSLTVELFGFGTELIQKFILHKNPGYSLELANTMSYIVSNTIGVQLIQLSEWLEHCYQVVIQGDLPNISAQEVLQRQIWLVNAYLDKQMNPLWLKHFHEIQLELGKTFLLYYIKKKNIQWERYILLDILNSRLSPRMLIDYCIAAYIIDELQTHGKPPNDLSSMEHVYMLQTSVEMACGQSVQSARGINYLISTMADADEEVQLARKRALNFDDTQSARILKRVNDLQVGCLRQSCSPQKGVADIPDELQYLGTEYARVYLMACEQGTKAVRRTRVMIVGHYSAGKTSLKRRLVNEAFSPLYEVTNGIEADPVECTIFVDNTSKNWNIIKKALGVTDEHSSEVARVLYDFIKMLKSTKLPVCDERELNTPDVEFAPDLACSANSNGESSDELDSPVITGDPEDGINDSPPSSIVTFDARSMRSLRMDALVSAMGAVGMTDANQVFNSLPKSVICELNNLMDLDPDHPYTRDYTRLQAISRQTSNEVKFSFWDFAGQHVFYTTHQTFLSHRAVYLLVLDLTRPLHTLIESHRLSRNGLVVDRACPQTVGEYLDYWLNSIHTHAIKGDSQQARLTQPPVIIVCTHRDILEKKYGKKVAAQMVMEYFRSINKRLDKKSYHDHVSPTFFTVANGIDNDPRLDLLREELVQVAENQPYWGEQIPLKWLALLAKLRKLQCNSGSVVTRTKVIELAREVGIQCSTEVVTFLLFYHALGELVFFDEDSLRELIILDPQWLIKNFCEVITVRQFHKQKVFANSRKHWSNLDDYGVLNDVILQKVWEPSNKDQLVSIMQKFNLILPIRPDYQPDDSFEIPVIPGAKTQLYLVPCMLPQATAEDIQLPGKADPCPLLFNFREGFVPLGVFHRLLATCINQMHWECFGVIYHDFASFLPWPEEMADVTISLRVHSAYIEVTARSVDNEDKLNAQCQKLLPHALQALTEQLLVAMRIVSPTQSFFLATRCTCRGPDQQGCIVNLEKFKTELATKKKLLCLTHKAAFNAQSIQPWFAKSPDIKVAPSVILTAPISPITNDENLPSDQQLLELAERIGKEWEQLTIHLGMTTANIEHLKMDHQNTVTRTTYMLTGWRCRQASLPLSRRIDHLIKGLLAVQRADLAEIVARWKMLGVNLNWDEINSENEVRDKDKVQKKDRITL